MKNDNSDINIILNYINHINLYSILLIISIHIIISNFKLKKIELFQ